ncbi:dipeptidase [Virgibacillus ainsalahensis]
MRKKLFYLIITAMLTSPEIFSALTDLGQETDAQELHTNAIVVDSHLDTLMKVVDEQTGLPQTDIGGDTDFEADLPKLHSGGLNVPFFAAYTPGYHDNNARSISETLASIHALYWIEENNAGQLEITSTLKEINQAISEGKIVAVPTIEGAYSLEKHNATELLQQYKDLGVTTIGFTWNYSNALGEGADRVYGDPASTPSDGGLTELGEKVAREMNRLGMMIDVSHLAESTFWDVLEVTEAPIIATHSGVDALNNHPRNLTDEQLIALAENGGVIGIVFYPEFLSNDGQADISDVVDHIDYAVDLIGIDHVALGSDFDGATLPNDMQHASDLDKITEELMERGYSSRDIKKILGRNTLRVLGNVQEAADSDVNNESNGPSITPASEMGEEVDSCTPLLTAEVTVDQEAAIDESSLRVIVDGIPHEPEFDGKTMSLQLTEALNERFHVVTFEAANEAGEPERQTRIFYVE